jgi:hypothetical protein
MTRAILLPGTTAPGLIGPVSVTVIYLNLV